MSETEAIHEALFAAILWVPKEDRELMIQNLAETVGPLAAEIVEDWYKIHAVNESE